MNIALTAAQVAHARLEGELRSRAHELGRDRNFTPPGWTATDDLEQHTNAAGAEIAAASLLGGSWDAMTGVHATCDVRCGPNEYQIRWSRHASAFLVVWATDDPAQRFVLVTGLLPAYDARGWIAGVHAKRDRYWHTANPRTGDPFDRPRYCIPQSDLETVQAIRNRRALYGAYLERPFREPWESMTFTAWQRQRETAP